MKQYRKTVLIALLLLIIAEMIWNWPKNKRAYNVKDTLANFEWKNEYKG